MKRKVTLSIVVLIPLAMVIFACSKGSSDAAGGGGPIDGDYTTIEWTCGSTNIYGDLKALGFSSIAVTVSNTTGSSVNTLGSCTSTQANTYAYPTSTTITVSEGATSCSSSCTASQCTVATAPNPSTFLTYNYSLSGSTLTLTRTIAAGDLTSSSYVYGTVGCTAGMTETYTLSTSTTTSTAFGYQGSFLDTLQSGGDIAQTIVIQSDGKIVVAGDSYTNSQYDFGLTRLISSGSLDFGNFGNAVGTGGALSGKQWTNISTASPPNDKVHSVTLQSDGKILVGGWSWDGNERVFALARYSASGILDTSFGSGTGFVTTNVVSGKNSEIYQVLVQSDGKIVAVGYADTKVALVRYGTGGTLDSGFGTSGIVTTVISSSGNDGAYAAAIQSDGKIVAVGFNSTTDQSTGIVTVVGLIMARYNAADGSLDSGGFGTSGKVTASAGSGGVDAPNSVFIQSNGKILVGGNSSSSGAKLAALMRYSSGGTLDTTFGTNGKATLNLTTSGTTSVQGAGLQSDGKVVFAGVSESSGKFSALLARFNADGSADTSFGSSGVAISSFGGSNSGFNAVAIQGDNKIVAAGSAYYGTGSTAVKDFLVARFKADGSLDN